MYELYYWPIGPGRGEFARLLMEEAEVPYIDVARTPEAEGGGVQCLYPFIHGQADGFPALAPPILKAGELVVAQAANICQFLARRHGLIPADEAGQAAVNQLQLTIADFISEIHDTHHPTSVTIAYEEQRAAAKRRSEYFVKSRLPKFLGYFERVLSYGGDDAGDRERYLVGAELSYADLSLGFVLDGLAHAFPNALAAVAGASPGVFELAERVRARPRVSAYLASERRMAFTQQGIFRRYPELDLASPSS
ncbi:MAG: glutathione S-transferase [Haliangiales bacterium]